jgi:hypothetical protein
MMAVAGKGRLSAHSTLPAANGPLRALRLQSRGRGEGPPRPLQGL